MDHVSKPLKFTDVGGIGNVKVLYVAANSSHTIAVTTTAEVWTWGENTYGHLGQEQGNITFKEAQLISKIPGTPELIGCGATHSIAFVKGGDTFAWGNQSCGRLGLEE